MPRIAFELDLPDSLAKAADERGLLSSQAVTELIKRELMKTAGSTPSGPGIDRRPWLDGIVAPQLRGQGKILVDDNEFLSPIEADWEAIRGQSK